MVKFELGDIFEIETSKGKGYFQCVHSDELRGELIKVFNHLFLNKPENIENILFDYDFYYLGFPLESAYRKKIVQKVGYMSLPKNFKIPKYMRSKYVVKGEFIGWHIINTQTLKRKLVSDLTEDQRQLSEYGIANDTFLINRLEEGWTPKKWK